MPNKLCTDTPNLSLNFCSSRPHLALRTKWGLDEQKFDDRFGVSVHNLFGNILEDLVTKGLLEYQNSSYHLSSEGAKHGNYVFSQFIRE